MKSKYRFVYVEDDRLVICVESKPMRPAFETELNITSINDKEIIGWITEYDCVAFSPRPKFEDVEDEYIEEYKTWFGLGPVKKRFTKSWVRMKNQSMVMRIPLKNYKLVYIE